MPPAVRTDVRAEAAIPKGTSEFLPAGMTTSPQKEAHFCVSVKTGAQKRGGYFLPRFLFLFRKYALQIETIGPRMQHSVAL